MTKIFIDRVLLGEVLRVLMGGKSEGPVISIKLRDLVIRNTTTCIFTA